MMKKLDLHIHTKSTISDSDFEFSLTKLEHYIETQEIDCIAITNHNIFDLTQFKQIAEKLNITVLPGIEINLENGHLLLISDNDELEEFEHKCNQINQLINEVNDFVNVNQLKNIFLDLRKYILIPHYQKKPNIHPNTITELRDYIFSGEVSSPKKFMYCINDDAALAPLYFSDLRFYEDMSSFSSRQTYLEIDEISVSSINNCLLDKNKIHLTREEGHSYFPIFETGEVLSTGLNVILGERSSGKSFTLRKINQLFENVKYVKQFELLETDEKNDVLKFNKLLSAKQSSVSEEYLSEFKDVVNDVSLIDRQSNNLAITNYLSSLLKAAREEEKKDAYSNAVLFNENIYHISDDKTLKDLIKSVNMLINNTEYKNIIDQFIPNDKLVKLFLKLVIQHRQSKLFDLKKLWINSLVSNIKTELQSFTASSSIREVDFFKILIEKEKIAKFNNLTELVKKTSIIEEKDIRRFKLVARTKPFSSAQELLNKFGKRATFSTAFYKYHSPIDYLDELKNIHVLEQSDYYKYFVKIDFNILNEYGIEVSGGERSEFKLLEKIQDARKYDMLLIDEPESSFDNLFLKNEVNELIKDISKELPVVIVTHNNTIGASIKPDYILYTKKEIINRKPVFKIFSGSPTSTVLRNRDGEEMSNFYIMLNCLEAGQEAYQERGKCYETLQN